MQKLMHLVICSKLYMFHKSILKFCNYYLLLVCYNIHNTGTLFYSMLIFKDCWISYSSSNTYYWYYNCNILYYYSESFTVWSISLMLIICFDHWRNTDFRTHHYCYSVFLKIHISL